MKALLSAALAAASLLAAAPAAAEWRVREEAIMGTRVAVEAWHEDAAVADAAMAAVFAEMHRVDRLMSHYKPESELSQVNARAAAGPVAVAPELAALIARALEFSVLTDGAFDITYASVGYLYDYRAGQRPDDAQIAAHLPAVNWRHVIVDRAASTVRFTQDGVRIDLGGIAKGYAVDRGVAILAEKGIRHGTVTAGGDTRILGDRLGRPWVIGIRHPDDRQRVVSRIPLVDAALSTSGDYERYFDEDGQRYHHIINPRTGRSAGELRSVTIIGPDATTTDGLSTGVFVLGAERGLALIERLRDVDAVLVTAGGKVLYSSGLAPP
ncbi:MAG: FAD:protein FMN transferase [Steroidobacteraceae bacterium]|jgi:thiamine biosynthesis lipoprotein|nr:FAD:protein FMN transferase [Steroidobacteraceae bacterium]